jgi:DNA-binding FrmR family transcriptional regulator
MVYFKEEIMDDVTEHRKQNVAHINRIIGQLGTLKTYMESGESCMNINQLATSIAKSFDSLRVKTLEGFIMNELLGGRGIQPQKLETLRQLLNLHKK